MATVLKAIVINNDPTVAALLAEKIKPEYEFEICDDSKTTREAVQAMFAESYDVCFISDSYAADDLQSLIRDVSQLPPENRCVIVQTCAALDPAFDRYSKAGMGVAAVLSHEFSQSDATAFAHAIKIRLDLKSCTALGPDIESATSTMLRELDFAASEKKRGREWNLKSLARNLIAAQINKVEGVRSMFYDILTKVTGDSQSFPEGKLDVPANLLARHPPGLEADSYTGPSKRVWLKLHKKFGKQGSQTPK